jgi:thymidylate synthase
MWENPISSATEYADNKCKSVIADILQNGSLDVNPRPKYEDGTPAHTYSINHVVSTFDLTRGDFPLISLRPIAVKKSIGEILWIYQDQSTDLDLLKDKYGVTWWDSWDIGDRTIGSCYGATVKKHDLINTLLKEIKDDPDGRRHILNLWQVDDFKEKHGLKPCACFSEYNVRHGIDDIDYLDGFLLLRSSDYLTAGCINQVQYVALLYMIARHCGYIPGKFTCVMVNCQIYDRHIENAKTMYQRHTIPANPYMELNPDKKNFYDITLDDFKIIGYPMDTIKKINPQLKFDLGI